MTAKSTSPPMKMRRATAYSSPTQETLIATLEGNYSAGGRRTAGRSGVRWKTLRAVRAERGFPTQDFRFGWKKLGDIALPALGTVFGSGGKWDHDEVFYAFQSFTVPPSIYRLDLKPVRRQNSRAPRRSRSDIPLDQSRRTLHRSLRLRSRARVVQVKGRHARADVHRAQERRH